MFPLSNHKNCERSYRQPKYSAKIRCCKVCGDTASIINYGALSCQSCKTFFRRNGLQSQNRRLCFFNRTCEINVDTRRKCTDCRLAKCRLVGMSSDLIRKEEKQEKKYPPPLCKASISNYTVVKQEMTVPQLWSCNLLYDDRSMLDNSEEKLLTNIITAIDIYSALPQVHYVIQNLYSSSSIIHFKEINTLQIIILSYISMRSFINATPDFRILTVNEQCSLIERNLNGIAVLYSTFIFRDARIISNYHYMNDLTSIYGLEIVQQTIHITKQLDNDPTIIKLMLIVLAFSSNCSIVDFNQDVHNDSLLYGTHRLLGSQNVYAELLWKYMICQYGYYTSALRFARFIQLVLDLIKYSANIYINNHTHHNLVDDFIQKTKELLIMNQNEQVPLWGKN
ncbi:unnamed protein product [Adineta steineri]|uniref:Nuclear receptor domain-containing protein n=1 Tax=Adineta steineri TaxID=433720 RepID=A0A815EJS1_9BILA|nr:unnamed protein product [Adineta steineri]CAF3559770.1 unnamed protein product [Adineta steineri]